MEQQSLFGESSECILETGGPMAAIHDLLRQVTDSALRQRLTEEFVRLGKNKQFGLVFEEHLPECAPLYTFPIRENTTVARKKAKLDTFYTVKSIKGDVALCLNKHSLQEETIPTSELVTIAQLGDPIFPSLESVDKICHAPDNPLWHILIEAENYHALQLLEYLYAGKVDCIYIDPPYNTGARDWKYNNDYVDGNDAWRHSKWLSMMKKRLLLAKKILNPKNSVLICTIDEKEYLHLGCLLEELFPNARIQMVSSVINPSGVSRGGEFYRTDEYLFFVKLGTAAPAPLVLPKDWITAQSTGKDSLVWRSIRRRGSNNLRQDAPNQFYPIFLTADGKHFAGAGESLPINASRQDYQAPEDKITLWPIKPDGIEGCWQISQKTFSELCKKGYTKISYTKKWGYVPQYLASGEQQKVEKGQFPILGYAEDHSILTDSAIEEAPFVPGTQWRIPSHNAREHGSVLLNKLALDKRFSFPKSVYAVHDAMRFFVADKPNALIVDFFAGSGTTLHAVNLLNAEDGGHRQCILVTNNEVSEAEAKKLSDQGVMPGDPEWENLGIARYVAWPRTVCSIQGKDMKKNPLKGSYLPNNMPMSAGFAANVHYFKLVFLDKSRISLGQQFREILPLLWMKAGSYGKCPVLLDKETLPPWLITNNFAVLLEEDRYNDFRQAIQEKALHTLYFVTNSEEAFREMSEGIEGAKTFQLYQDYLDNFVLGARRAK